jgi:crossover junction endodeoxyribonuclease RuvC
MLKKKIKILAVDPGTREMGIAILENEALTYFGVKTLKKKRPADVLIKTVRQTIYRLCDDYAPDILAIEKTFFSGNRELSLLHVVADEVRYAAKRRGLKVISYAPFKIRKFICGDAKATKQNAAVLMVSRYPELKVYLLPKSEWKKKYWLNMFDAVALGLTCYLMEHVE